MHPTDAEIAEIERLPYCGSGPSCFQVYALCAAARDRNRLEVENAKLREAYRREVILGICEPASIHRMVASYLCEACSQRWSVGESEVHLPNCLARPSQLETDNG